ncbi:NADH dehydrogenase [ubiquinone] iron-sulfur protein 5 [Chaetodon auriga]|uniref:NADH dehydrogenase [ubiquinone] iron-sulfur protein 5 n=1 Tax=Chaetodon auriga TaxID=39042 RepID=UPI004032A4F7
MPLLDLKARLGLGLDRWLLLQSGEQPEKKASRCHAFEKEWVECSHGIGLTRAKRECQVEWEDFYECMHRGKTFTRLYEIRKQRDKMVKEGTYTPPPCHSGQAD